MPLLGIDIGTSELKAALFEEDGVCVGVSSSEYSHSNLFPGNFELDPELLWKKVCKTTRDLLNRAANPEVRAVAFSVHGESFVCLDSSDRAIGPIILNLDGRAAQEMDDFVSTFGSERLYEITGLPAHPMYTLPKICWLRKHQPEIFAKTRRFMCIEDYLLLRGTGAAAIDLSLASRTLGLDINKGSWHPQLLSFAGIAGDRLAPVISGGAAVGRTALNASAEIGLPTSTVWVAGGHDQACTSLGAGGLASGTAVDGTGTFECISVATEDRIAPRLAHRANIPCERHCVPGRFLSLTYSPGGIALKWLREQCGRELSTQARSKRKSTYDLLLADCVDDPTGLLFLPYLVGTGTPWLDSKATGVLYGLNVGTTRGTLAKAVLEGVTCEMRWNLEMLALLDVPVEDIIVVGGGSKSRVWMQLKADIFGRLVRSMTGEAACRGAALCAGIGSGLYTSFEDTPSAPHLDSTIYEPRVAVHQRYNEIFEQYKELAHRVYGYKLPAACSQTHA